MTRRSFAKSSAQSIPSFGGVSLTGPGWMVRHKDSWGDKHHEFFGNSSVFYQNTTSAPTPTQNNKNKIQTSKESRDIWVIETAGGQLLGRVQIQATQGDFNHAVLHICLNEIPAEFDLKGVLSELITSQFLGRSLDAIKLFPIGAKAREIFQALDPNSHKKILSLSTEWLVSPIFPMMLELDREQWLASELGQSTCEKLGWLSRRVERANAVNNRDKKETKRPWILSLLFMGRRRHEKMVHPLDKLRSRF